jgi:branched-subunit amino acid transport protein
MATSYGPVAILATIVVIGVITYAIRLSFIALLGQLDEMPTPLEQALRYVPAAVLAALVLPSFVTLGPDATGLAVDRVLAGGIAAGVAWRTEDVLATMVAGMGALWVVRLLV